MNGKLFGVSIVTLLIILVVAVVVQKWGAKIPGLNMVPRG